jgi:hypothetical protein
VRDERQHLHLPHLEQVVLYDGRHRTSTRRAYLASVASSIVYTIGSASGVSGVGVAT